MKTRAHTHSLLLAGLLAVGGCHKPDTQQEKPQAAVMTIFYDGSRSTAINALPAYGDAAIDKVGKTVMRQQLGDAFRIVTLGSRTADRAVDALSLTSDRRLRLAAVRKRVEIRLRELLAHDRQQGGDDATNILYTLQNAHPICTPGSSIILLSDGIEDSETYSASKALAARQPVRLPPPGERYLKGCTVAFIGIGISPVTGSPTTQTLPNDQLQALTAGWRDYLTAAGVRPDAVTFTSIL